MLLEYGAGKARVRSMRNELDDALYKAIENGHVETVGLLMDNGAKVYLPIYRAIINRRNDASIDLIKLLIEKGADINEQDDQRGETPLMTAARADIRGKEQLIDFLIKSGADINITDKNGNNVMLNFIYYEGGDDYYLKTKNEKIVPFLIKEGLDVNGRNSITGQTALMITHSTNITRILIENGAEIEVKDFEGNTALALAAGWGALYENKIKFLMEKGAKINAVNNKGMTILQLVDQAIEKARKDDVILAMPGALEECLRHYNEIKKILKAAGAHE